MDHQKRRPQLLFIKECGIHSNTQVVSTRNSSTYRNPSQKYTTTTLAPLDKHAILKEPLAPTTPTKQTPFFAIAKNDLSQSITGTIMTTTQTTTQSATQAAP